MDYNLKPELMRINFVVSPSTITKLKKSLSYNIDSKSNVNNSLEFNKFPSSHSLSVFRSTSMERSYENDLFSIFRRPPRKFDKDKHKT